MLSCNCRMFEIKGVLRSHIIKVLRDNMNIKEITARYILKRWTIQARFECVQDMYGCEIQADPNENAYNLANEHASNLSRLVEDILCLEMNGNEHVKDQNSQDTNKKETYRGRRRFKSSLKVSLAKKNKSNPPQHSKAAAYLLPMVVNEHYKPAINGHSLVNNQASASATLHSVSRFYIEQSQQAKFQSLLQQNKNGFSFGIQDSQATNNTNSI
ncbi:hypothetical protein ACOSP7_009540 [Xanthoceras sorbifolium]